MSLDTPTPQNSSDDPQDTLDVLRAKLKEQRAAQKACLAKHKRTTFMAVEGARKATTFYDPARLRAELDLEEEAEEGDASSAE